MGVRFSEASMAVQQRIRKKFHSHFGTPQSSRDSGDSAEGLQGLAQTRNVFPFSLTVQGELASVAIAIAVAHCTRNSNGFTRIRKSKLNFEFFSELQFHSRHYTHPPFANLCAPSVSYHGCVLFVENNPEWDVEFVAYRATLALVRRRQAGNDLSGHNANLTVLFPLVDVTEVLIVRPSRSCAAFLFWENDGRSHSEGIGLQALSPCPPDWPPTMEGFFLSITSKYVGGQSNAVLGISLQEFPPHCTDGVGHQ
jgi:hypothetical protein